MLGSVIFVSLFLTIPANEEEEVSTLEPYAAPKLSRVLVGETEIFVEVVDTPKERTQGLSGRETLKENEGMLFIFEKSSVYSFWMKEMRFSIDIIWIDESFRVADITERANPESFPNTFNPNVPIRYVLEVPAGFIQKYAIARGGRVTFFLEKN